MTLYITPSISSLTANRLSPRFQAPATTPVNSAPAMMGSDQISRKLLMMLGVPIDNLTMVETLDAVEKMVKIGRKTGKTHQIATVNVDFLIKAQEDETLRHLLQEADLCTADGMPLIWASNFFGTPLKERVAGSDMLPLLAERAAQKGLTLYFMGAREGVAAKAADILRQRHPQLQIVGTSSPYWKPGQAMDQAVLDEIKQLKPDILLVAFGNPKQELWIKEYGQEVGVPVMIGVGASLDFVAGTVKRAPTWMQKTGLEWLGRLAQEPKRLAQRYLSNFAYFPQIFQQWRAVRSQDHSTAPFGVDYRTIGETAILNIKGRFDYAQCKRFATFAQYAIDNRPNITVNLAQLEYLDCAAAGALLQFVNTAHRNGSRVRFVGIQRPHFRLFQLLGLTEALQISSANCLLGQQY